MAKFISGWDESKPAGTRSKILGDDDIREFKQQFRERFAIDHVALQNEVDDTLVGFHNQVTLVKQASDPLPLTDALILFTKKTGSYSELYGKHENAGTLQYTQLGKLLISALGITGEADGDLIMRISGAFARFALGTASQWLRVNAGATGLEYFTPPAYITLADLPVTSFGAWTAKSTDTVYQAATDGFVVATINYSGGFYTDSANPPTVNRIPAEHSSDVSDHIPLCVPVKKGDYWKVTSAYSVYWLPMGA